MPESPFTARSPYLANPPASYGSVWYGNAELWTMLRPTGELWRGLPLSGGTFSQKTFWWSENYSGEGQPAISVTGTRLDRTGTFAAGNRTTNATADFGTAMLVGIEMPSAGCWRIRAEYKGASLEYVVSVE